MALAHYQGRNCKILWISLFFLLFVCLMISNSSGNWYTEFTPLNAVGKYSISQTVQHASAREFTNLTLQSKLRRFNGRNEQNSLELTDDTPIKINLPKKLADLIGKRKDGKKPTLPSHLVPVRGFGDSYLPFEDKYTLNTKKVPKDIFKEKTNLTNPDLTNPPLKKILFWNEVFGDNSFYFGFGWTPFLLAGCKVNTCVTTADRERFAPEEIDAVIWHVRSYDKSLPSRRSPHTRYVFWSLEAPPHTDTNLTEFNNVFNWTFTYRLDSDFPNPYGVVYRRRSPLSTSKSKNHTSGKTRLAAWFVSNCVTYAGRETLVRTLQKWIEIDVFGKCGPHECDRSHQERVCFKMLEKDYKFYMSFENSLCKDYATEKIFDILRLNVVPVVYGLSNYSAVLPPHSYISALDFPSAKDLADHLLYLDKNDTAYNEYFQWKRYHRVPNNWYVIAKPWCDLCERLHNDHLPKVYDLQKWFNEDSHCEDFNTPRISRFIHGLPQFKKKRNSEVKK